MKFSLLHPSRSRALKSFQATQQWLNNSDKQDYELIVSIDSNDPDKDYYQSLYRSTKARIIINDNRSAVDAINNAAKVSQGEILIVVSDDTGCVRSWDTILSKATEGHSDYVLKVYDGIQKWIVTMPVMDRVYYNRYGFVYYPAFKHMFCDTFLTHQADALKKVIWRNDITIPHLHYSVTRSGKDPVTVAADSTLHEGERVYKNLVDQNLLIEGNIWDLSEYASGHIQWAKNKNWI